MSQTCECAVPSITVPVTGLKLELAESAFDNIGGAPGGAGIDYSLEEQWTGKRWIDGKKVYQKTILFGSGPNASKKSVPLNIGNIDRIISGNAMYDNGSAFLPLSVANTDGINHSFIKYSKTDVTITSKYNYTSYSDTHVTIHYTCTDR